jgi:hypothetical protein
MTQIGLLALQNRSVGIQLTIHEHRLWKRIIPPGWGKSFEAPVTSKFHLTSKARAEAQTFIIVANADLGQ